jgi:serine/threonine protein kinase
VSQNYEHFGKYILLEKLATGGMAEVWLARATQAGGIAKFVAVKKILPQYSDNPEFMQMFKDEAGIAMSLSHSNIVSIYGYDQHKEQLYLVMDYVEGRNLRQILNKMKTATAKFAVSQIVYIIKEVAAGLDHAHRCLNSATGKPLNITHRDMSPQNVMVSFEGEVKIVDFGIAKAESQVENTKTGTLKGKFGYMSPEQAEGLPTDLRTDIFSLGIVLWELLANDRLFIANNEINTLRKIRECQVPSLSKINPNIHPELERITNKALTRDRNLRYQTSAAMHRDLSRFLNKHDPEFTPHDFAVFIKTLYTDEILDTRKKLVEYSKVPARNEVGKQRFEEDKTQITSFAQESDVKPGVDESTLTATATATGGFTGGISISNASPDDKTEVSGTLSAMTTTSNPEVKSPNRPSDDSGVLNLDLINQNLNNQIQVNPRLKTEAPVYDDTANGLAVENVPAMADKTQFRAAAQQRPRQRQQKKKSSSSVANFVVFVAFMIGTYVLVSSLYPNQTQQFEGQLKLWLNGPSTQFNITELLSTVGVQKPQIIPQQKVQSINVPDFLRDEKPAAVNATQNTAPETVTIVVQSKPSGAEIYINGKSTGQTTPARVDIPTVGTFNLGLKKDRYIDYSQEKLSASQVKNKFEAKLQPDLTAFVDIIIKPQRQNVKIYVNNRLLEDEPIPVTRYAVPAKSNVTIRAESPTENLKAESVIYLQENERQTVTLELKN